jgi:hypothetical protein
MGNRISNGGFAKQAIFTADDTDKGEIKLVSKYKPQTVVSISVISADQW